METEALKARVASAKDRHAQLAAKCREFLSGSKPYEVYAEPMTEIGMFAIRIRVLRDPPLDWGVDVGDIAHGLRSALNQLVTELVKANNGKPNRSNQFPIFIDQHAYRDKGQRGASPRDRHLSGIARRDKKMIDAVQPFGRVPKSMHRDPFAQLQWLNNRDKHVELQPAFVSVSKWGLSARHPQPGKPPKLEMRLSNMTPRGPMNDGELLVEAGWSGQRGVELTADETECAVGFGERGVQLEELDRMVLAVSALIDRAASRYA